MARIVGIAGALGILLAGCADTRPLGAPAALGDGGATSYAEFAASGAPSVIGVAISARAMESLPTVFSDGHQCYVADGAAIDLETHCMGWHERVLPLPSEASRRADMPFKWVMLNWNPKGHMPPGVYDTPHFDLHFFMEPIERVLAIRPGPCGPEKVRCDQFERGRKPVPANYMHPDFKDVEAVAPAMGNHLIDPSAREFHGEAFTRTWIYGVYDGRVTFYEEMVTVKYLLTQPSTCFPIKTPPAVAVAGYYPTLSCIRYDAARAEYTVSLEGFQMRQAGPPAM